MPNPVPRPRLVKMFSVVTKRFYPKDGSPRTERPIRSLDDCVNEWVGETGNDVVSATPGLHTHMEKARDGTLIRRTVQLLAVIYQSSKIPEVEEGPQRISDLPAVLPVPSDAGGPADFIDLPPEDEDDEL